MVPCLLSCVSESDAVSVRQDCNDQGRRSMNSATSDDPVLQDFLKGIEQVRPLISKVILFGSRAKGTHRLDSDYDLLLVVDRKEEALLDRLYEAVMDVLLAHGRLISLKIFPKAEFDRLQALHTPFMTQIAEEGVPIG